MEEVETRVFGIDTKELKEKLIKKGAKKIFEGLLEARFLKKDGKVIRIRKEGSKNKLSFKIKQKDKHIRIQKEYEVEISDAETLKNIFLELGFKEEDNYIKKRESYLLNGIRFEFDKIISKDIPEFVEIEAKNKEDLNAAIKYLGIDFEKCKNWTYGEIKKSDKI